MRLLKLQKSTSNDIISLFDPQKKEQKELELNQQDKNLLVQYQDEI